jgi:hypothetical protein
MLVNNGGERRKGGNRVNSFYCWPTGWSRVPPVRPVMATGQTGDRPWSGQWALSGFSDPMLGSTDDFDKFNRETISVDLASKVLILHSNK